MKCFWTYIKHDRKLITDPILNANVMNHQCQSAFSSTENYPLGEFDKRCNMPPGSKFHEMTDITLSRKGVAKLLLI